MTDLEMYQNNVVVWNRRLGTSVPIPESLSPAVARGYSTTAVALAKCLRTRGTTLRSNVLITLASLVYTKNHSKEWGGHLAVAVRHDPAMAVEAYTLVAECIELRQERGGLMNQIHRCVKEGKDVDTWE